LADEVVPRCRWRRSVFDDDGLPEFFLQERLNDACDIVVEAPGGNGTTMRITRFG